VLIFMYLAIDTAWHLENFGLLQEYFNTKMFVIYT